METKKFKISKRFIIKNYVIIVVLFISAMHFMFGPVFLWHSSTKEIIVNCILGIIFSAGAIYSIKIVPQLKDSILISDSQIMREHSADGSFTSIWWSENFTIRKHRFLERLELISQDGSRVVKIEYQTEGFKEICELISAKLIEKQGNSVEK